MKIVKGMEIRDTEGRTYIIEDKIGEGAQGAVYNTNSEAFLIKIIRAEAGKEKELMEHLEWIMNQRIHSEARIITPLALLAEPFTGYVMKKAKGHESLNNYLYKPSTTPLGEWYNIQTGGLRKRIEMAISLSKCYRQLHLHGLCYCDVSPNNILVARHHKSIVLIDSDNLTSTSLYSPSILGTPRYIAPELFSLNKQPNSITDTYSFAVILFELLKLGHPLIGDEILNGTPEKEEEALKGNTVYVDHPTDKSNQNTSILPSDVILTEELRELFQRMFVDGLHDYMKRPTLYEFTVALQKAEDLLVKCDNSHCRGYFYKVGNNEQKCPWCEEKKRILLTVGLVETTNLTDEIFIDKKKKLSEIYSTIVLNDEAKAIYRRHIDAFVSQEQDKVVAIIKRLDSDSVAIKNCSGENFTILNRETREQKIFKPDETKRIIWRKESVLLDFQKNVVGLRDVFEENNKIKSLFFASN